MRRISTKVATFVRGVARDDRSCAEMRSGVISQEGRKNTQEGRKERLVRCARRCRPLHSLDLRAHRSKLYLHTPHDVPMLCQTCTVCYCHLDAHALRLSDRLGHVSGSLLCYAPGAPEDLVVWAGVSCSLRMHRGVIKGREARSHSACPSIGHARLYGKVLESARTDVYGLTV